MPSPDPDKDDEKEDKNPDETWPVYSRRGSGTALESSIDVKSVE